MSLFNVALLQLPSQGWDVDASLAAGDEACREAATLGADVALFPELWQVGYRLPQRHDPAMQGAFSALAIDTGSDYVGYFCDLARELDMAIALTFLQRHDAGPRNALALIDRHGAIALTTAKVHTCDFGDECVLTPGDGFPVAALDTRIGPVRLGAMICYDREFPESARLLMLNGVEIILTPNACTIDAPRQAQLMTRAYENMVGVALANYTAPLANGRSVAYDGMAYGPDERARDMLIVQAGSAPGVLLAPFDMAALRDYRQRETWGDAYRRPGVYGPLTRDEVRPPFVRRMPSGEGVA